jgi:hypothetical protein
VAHARRSQARVAVGVAVGTPYAGGGDSARVGVPLSGPMGLAAAGAGSGAALPTQLSLPAPPLLRSAASPLGDEAAGPAFAADGQWSPTVSDSAGLGSPSAAAAAEAAAAEAAEDAARALALKAARAVLARSQRSEH